ncbi:hypothetical protein [Haladaptatus sp. NG-WS-4]
MLGRVKASRSDRACCRIVAVSLEFGQDARRQFSRLLDVFVRLLAPRLLDVREQFVGLRDARFDDRFRCVSRVADDRLSLTEILARSRGDR